MNFAFLGIDNAVTGLARAVCAAADHHVVSVFAGQDRCQQLRAIAPAAQYSEAWELLLEERHADAVIVAADDSSETRNDQLRKLVQAGVPLMLIHPACDAMVGYELEMIRTEAGGVLVPYVPGQRHPRFRSVGQWMADEEDSPIGRVEQVVVEHFSHDRSSRAVLASLVSDVGLLMPMIGRVDEVSAFGPSPGDVQYPTLSVNMTGSKNVPVRWSVAAVESDEGTVTTFVAARGRAVLSMLGNPSGWTLTAAGVTELLEADAHQANDTDAAAAIADFTASIAGHKSAIYTWPEACRTLEVSTAVGESLRRGRKIKLYDDQYSEQQTFKGKMAAAGCLLLMVVLMMLFGFALFDGLSTPFRDKQVASGGPSEPGTSLWLRLWPAYPLIAFLLLQLLKLVFIGRRPTASQSRPTN